MEKLINNVQLAEMLGVNLSTIYRMRQRPGFPSPIKIYNSIRWRLRDVEDFINRCKSASVKEEEFLPRKKPGRKPGFSQEG